MMIEVRQQSPARSLSMDASPLRSKSLRSTSLPRQSTVASVSHCAEALITARIDDMLAEVDSRECTSTEAIGHLSGSAHDARCLRRLRRGRRARRHRSLQCRRLVFDVPGPGSLQRSDDAGATDFDDFSSGLPSAIPGRHDVGRSIRGSTSRSIRRAVHPSRFVPLPVANPHGRSAR